MMAERGWSLGVIKIFRNINLRVVIGTCKQVEGSCNILRLKCLLAIDKVREIHIIALRQ
jgi:hypothetical protein